MDPGAETVLSAGPVSPDPVISNKVISQLGCNRTISANIVKIILSPIHVFTLVVSMCVYVLTPCSVLC